MSRYLLLSLVVITLFLSVRSQRPTTQRPGGGPSFGGSDDDANYGNDNGINLNPLKGLASLAGIGVLGALAVAGAIGLGALAFGAQPQPSFAPAFQDFSAEGFGGQGFGGQGFGGGQFAQFQKRLHDAQQQHDYHHHHQ